MNKSLASALCVSLFAGLALSLYSHVVADERRAKPPKFTDSDTRQVFFPKLSDAIKGERPSLADLQKKAQASAAAVNAAAVATAGGSRGGNGKWSSLISSSSVEDEIKRVKLHFDGVVTTPGAFKSGGYQDARRDLSVLAVLFGVINEHADKEIRWKDQAAAARDLLARSAFNCKAGSTQVYNEAKLRKADLQDLIAGSGLAKTSAESKNDWGKIVDRTPMMEYAEYLRDSLKEVTNNTAAIKANSDQVKRDAELVAMVGEVLIQEGLDDFDDEDYAAMSKSMSKAALNVVGALERNDGDAVRKGVGAVAQSCETCHEQYR